MEVEFNGVVFRPLPGVKYPHDYQRIAEIIEDWRRTGDRTGPNVELSYIRQLVRSDLFFLTHFIMKIPCANTSFWVAACQEVQNGPRDRICDKWAREHGKTTIVTIGTTVQDCVAEDGGCEERICIFSYALKLSQTILRSIKTLFEQSDILKAAFPDILWNNPAGESPQWSTETGITLRRQGFYKEATVEAAGLIDGMPTGRHYTRRKYDDVVTDDLVRTPELLTKVQNAFVLSECLGAEGGTVQVTGTPYHYEDLLTFIGRQRNPLNGSPLWTVREKPAVEPRSFNGKSVFLSEDRLQILKADKRTFAAQYLLDPNPAEMQALNPDHLVEIDPSRIPPRLYKFELVDPAGRAPGKDSWAIGLIGVDPFRDDLGASDIYILDLVISPMEYIQAMAEIVRMYMKGGRVLKLGVEVPANSTWDLHIQNALKAKGKHLSIESGNLVLLKHAGRSKEFRIEYNLGWPLNNGKIHISTGIQSCFRERLKEEMRKFPFWHDDGIDMLAYGYDLIKDYRFPARSAPVEEDKYAQAERRARQRARGSDGWLYA